MRMTGIAAWAVATAMVTAMASAQARPQVDVAPFVKADRYGRIKISPDGAHLAATVPMEDRTALVLLSRAGRKVVASAAGYRNSAVHDFWWVDDRSVVIAMAQTFGSKDPLYMTGELHALSIDGKRVKTLFGARDQPGLVTTYGMRTDIEYATVVDPRPGTPGTALIATWKPETTPRTWIERMDIATGRRETVAVAPIRRAWFTMDAAGAVRFAHGADERNDRELHYRESDDAPWRLVNDSGQSGFIADALGMAADGFTAYVQVTMPEGPDAIEAWDMRTLERTPLLRDPAVDPSATIFDFDRRTPVGALYRGDGAHMRFFDESGQVARTYRMLEKAFAGSAVAITSMTDDGRLALLRVWSDRTPGEYYLFDLEKRSADIVFAGMEWFYPAQVPPTRHVELQARDGATLRGYLTLPRESAGRDLPLVLMPHGGPYRIHDDWSFDLDTQLLAAAGYAVLRVNFRGSGNYGRAFELLGAREWGGTMQDDLTDATRWAIAQGIADPQRICIVGASYGGYAALMGVAREPELYRCAVGYVGVYDLPAMHADDARHSGWMRHWANDWVGERETLAAKSPVNLAAQIRAPVFLAAGGADDVAPILHSRRMERALKAAGVPVETLYIASEGHGFRKIEHRREYYLRLLDFLATHLGGARGR